MPTSGTENAAVIWKIAESSPTPVSEAEVRHATRLGAGTVNRLLRTMTAHGCMVRHEARVGDVTRYSTKGTIEEVRKKFCRRRVECAPRPAPGAVLSHFGPHIRRVSSVWELGSLP